MQSLYPDHYSIRAAAAQDYRRSSLARSNSGGRCTLSTGGLVLINVVVRGSFARCRHESTPETLVERVRRLRTSGVRVIGPAPAALGRRLRTNTACRFFVKGHRGGRAMRLRRSWRPSTRAPISKLTHDRGRGSGLGHMRDGTPTTTWRQVRGLVALLLALAVPVCLAAQSVSVSVLKAEFLGNGSPSSRTGRPIPCRTTPHSCSASSTRPWPVRCRHPPQANPSALIQSSSRRSPWMRRSPAAASCTCRVSIVGGVCNS